MAKVFQHVDRVGKTRETTSVGRQVTACCNLWHNRYTPKDVIKHEKTEAIFIICRTFDESQRKDSVPVAVIISLHLMRPEAVEEHVRNMCEGGGWTTVDGVRVQESDNICR